LIVFLLFIAGTLLYRQSSTSCSRSISCRSSHAISAPCCSSPAYRVRPAHSSLTDSQVVASRAPSSWLLPLDPHLNEAAVSSSLVTVLSQVSTFDHFHSFSRGVIDLKDVAYFVLFVGLFVFLTLRSMESRQWRGRR
jgi:hypothetical protein